MIISGDLPEAIGFIRLAIYVEASLHILGMEDRIPPSNAAVLPVDNY